MNIEHDIDAQEFFVALEGVRAFLGYRIENGEMIIYTTQVPEALGGKGIGSLLAKTALNFAVEQELKIVPLCSFISTYIEKHKEYQDYL